ncbi:cytochrome c oxidase assembly protein [Afifella sp. IM 167]|uniref:cytochrome c oxidase assembly protein n=1 Tax=Afifella sp. IM 167 TaxID=2033586 RepID=UPI001CCB032C|nr:cytochrome c oxidase assembly protein [Afifella sp. IM 167]
MTVRKKARGNLFFAALLGVVAVSMVGAAYAAVPLYYLFCSVTGYGGTTQRATAGADRVLDRVITVRFDSNVAGGLPWKFKPEQASIRARVGETYFVTYRAENLSDHATTGAAVFNVAPDQSGAYFNKIACFCFTQQTLEPGESTEMGVQFFLDPALMDDSDMKPVTTVTLSYTFFPQEPDRPAKPVAAAGGAKPTEKL